MRVCSIILAAGGSKRFGEDKLSVIIEGRTVLERVLMVAEKFGETIVVLNEERDIPGVVTVINEKWREGIGTSVSVGARKALKMECDLALFFLADMPFMMDECVKAVMEALDDKHWIFYPWNGRRKGFPTAAKREALELAKDLKGDKGLIQLIKSWPNKCKRVEVDREECFFDIDRPEDLERFRK